MNEQQLASYAASGLPSFVTGNPLAEALPLPLTGPELAGALVRAPIGNFDGRLDTPLGGFMELSTLCDINLPRLQSGLAAARILSMLYNTYSRCHPFSAETQKRLNSIDHEALDRAEKAGLQVDAMSILGWSGMGKTTLIRSLLGLYPQVIVHHRYREAVFFQKQVVYLSVDAPIGASPKGLLLNIAAALDKALGLEGTAGYVHQMHKGKNSVEVQRVLLARALASHYVGLLHIDDLQRLGEGPKLQRQASAATIVSMANSIGCAILFSGTPAALPVLQANFEVSRRATRRGSISILAPTDHTDPFFSGLVSYLCKFQLAKDLVVPTPELCKTLLRLTGGIPGVLTSLYVAAQETALTYEVKVDASLFRTVMEEQFSIIVPAIRVLNQARLKGRLEWDAGADDVVSRFLSGRKENGGP